MGVCLKYPSQHTIGCRQGRLYASPHNCCRRPPATKFLPSYALVQSKCCCSAAPGSTPQPSPARKPQQSKGKELGYLHGALFLLALISLPFLCAYECGELAVAGSAWAASCCSSAYIWLRKLGGRGERQNCQDEAGSQQQGQGGAPGAAAAKAQASSSTSSSSSSNSDSGSNQSSARSASWPPADRPSSSLPPLPTTNLLLLPAAAFSIAPAAVGLLSSLPRSPRSHKHARLDWESPIAPSHTEEHQQHQQRATQACASTVIPAASSPPQPSPGLPLTLIWVLYLGTFMLQPLLSLLLRRGNTQKMSEQHEHRSDLPTQQQQQQKQEQRPKQQGTAPAGPLSHPAWRAAWAVARLLLLAPLCLPALAHLLSSTGLASLPSGLPAPGMPWYATTWCVGAPGNGVGAGAGHLCPAAADACVNVPPISVVCALGLGAFWLLYLVGVGVQFAQAEARRRMGIV
ncbi:hypothetical protein DUNSADRAFT_1034 [Dunaliella salina]|uniref:Uncharacterized protein n=1 Tax=Dunaliella salina TaxID=3046 RepID=A0ABQ7GXL2_DUNSA|nr:hypothetical protein DUNSADRAFT_1034 [Dunaliella salina]|eukprot:KAF5839350.1 hypothetical protein DUNSADRAFT_1034 [Dunaliella salina]